MAVISQSKAIKKSSHQIQKILVKLSIFYLGIGIGVTGYILFSGMN